MFDFYDFMKFRVNKMVFYLIFYMILFKFGVVKWICFLILLDLLVFVVKYGVFGNIFKIFEILNRYIVVVEWMFLKLIFISDEFEYICYIVLVLRRD